MTQEVQEAKGFDNVEELETAVVGEAGEADTLSYTERLTSMVKSNHHMVNLEAQLLKAKKHFKKRSKSELIDIYSHLILPAKLDRKRKDGLHTLAKAALIAVVIKAWMERKQEEIRLSKMVTAELESNPELQEKVLELTETKEDNLIIGVDLGYYGSLADLPETPQWDKTLWEEELDKAIKQGYNTIKTPDGSHYKIVNRDQVISIPKDDAINRNGGESDDAN